MKRQKKQNFGKRSRRDSWKQKRKKREKREGIREKGGLKETSDSIQSHRLFAAVMFNYFRGLGIKGFGGNSHQSSEESK